MRINSRQLIGLPVMTKSGQDVGKVGSVDVDGDSGRIMTIRVKTRGFVQGLLDQEFFVDWSQVISIDEDKVVVRDASVPGGAKALASLPAEQTASASGAFLAQEEEG